MEIKKVLEETLLGLQAVTRASDIKMKRNFADFLSDKIVQAATESTLLGMFEKLVVLMDCDISLIDKGKTVNFFKASSSEYAPIILEWIRDFSKVTAIILKSDNETVKLAIDTIEIDTKIIDNKGTALKQAKCDLDIKVKCLSPLAHGGDIKAGNATLFRRMQVLSTTETTLNLPFYAGNAFRGQLRDVLADHFLKSLGLTPRRDIPPCELWFFHVLYAGGALTANSKESKNINKLLGNNGAIKADGINQFRNTLPAISLLGGALGNRIISGRINVCDFKPECKQWNSGQLQAGDLFTWIFLTRREDHEQYEAGENSSMIANTECLKAGTILSGGIDFSLHINELEKSCLSTGLKLMQNRGYLGAENRRGLGSVNIDCQADVTPTIYEGYLKEKKNEILDYLDKIGGIVKHALD